MNKKYIIYILKDLWPLFKISFDTKNTNRINNYDIFWDFFNIHFNIIVSKKN
jgi:hypothetical protein